MIDIAAPRIQPASWCPASRVGGHQRGSLNMPAPTTMPTTSATASSGRRRLGAEKLRRILIGHCGAKPAASYTLELRSTEFVHERGLQSDSSFPVSGPMYDVVILELATMGWCARAISRAPLKVRSARAPAIVGAPWVTQEFHRLRNSTLPTPSACSIRGIATCASQAWLRSSSGRSRISASRRGNSFRLGRIPPRRGELARFRRATPSACPITTA